MTPTPKIKKLWPHLPVADVQRAVDFYCGALGFADTNPPNGIESERIFTIVSLDGYEIRLELWRFDDWEPYRAGFGISTIWIEIDDLDSFIAHLDNRSLPYSGPSVEDYGSREIELHDPDGHRIVVAQPVVVLSA